MHDTQTPLYLASLRKGMTLTPWEKLLRCLFEGVELRGDREGGLAQGLGDTGRTPGEIGADTGATTSCR